MRTVHASLARRVTCGASVIALAAAGLVGVAAQAAEAPVGPQYGNIDQSATGSITVHKRESGSQGATVGTVASETAVPGSTPVPGVTFTAYKLMNFNPADGTQWQTLKDLQVPANACENTGQLQNYTLGTAKPFADKTDSEGKATLNNLEVGAYLVCETDAPPTVLKKALPFVVTMPFPDAVTKGWVYHVHTYPKNTVVQAPIKGQTISSNGLATADAFTFTIEAKVPSIAADEHFKYFTIADPLIAEMTNIKIENVTVDGAQVPGKYTSEVNEGKHYAAVHFNRDGLNELKGKANKKVVVTIKATLTSLPTNGVVPNVGYLYVDTMTQPQPPTTPPVPPVTPPDTPGTPPTVPPNTPSTPSNKVSSQWGQLKILKKDAGDNAAVLEGAEFEVYLAAKQDAANPECTDKETSGAAISVSGQSVFRSNASGTVDIAGLLIEKKEATGDAEISFEKTHLCYVVKETKAPVGYTLPNNVFTGVKVTPGPTATQDIEITNTRVTVPELPLTGASGQVLMIVGGSALVLLAGGVALVSRRRRAVED